MMETNRQPAQRAVLVALDTGEYEVEQSLAELEELARTAGAQVTGRMVQRRPTCDPATPEELLATFDLAALPAAFPDLVQVRWE